MLQLKTLPYQIILATVIWNYFWALYFFFWLSLIFHFLMTNLKMLLKIHWPLKQLFSPDFEMSLATLIVQIYFTTTAICWILTTRFGGVCSSIRINSTMWIFTPSWWRFSGLQVTIFKHFVFRLAFCGWGVWWGFAILTAGPIMRWRATAIVYKSSQRIYTKHTSEGMHSSG